MKTAVETLSPTRVKLSVEIPFDDLKPSLDAACARIAKQVNIPGFRKGKVPARVIEQRFGREVVLEEAINDAVPKAYDEAVRENKIVPVSRPDVAVGQLKDGAPLTFTAEVDIRPEFELPDYASLSVEVDPVVVSDDDVAAQVDSLRTRFATLTDVDRAARDGDVLLVDVTGATPQGDPVDDLSGPAMSYELGTDGLLPDSTTRSVARARGRIALSSSPRRTVIGQVNP